jgi:hypothetical protein
MTHICMYIWICALQVPLRVYPSQATVNMNILASDEPQNVKW